MKQLYEGLDYKLYKIYIWGGLPLIVIYIMVATLVFDVLSPPGPQSFLILITPLTLWFAGILLYWWWVFLFKGNKELEALARQPEMGIPGISALKSWNRLHQAMAINGGDVGALIKNRKEAQRPLLLWYGSLNLLAIWIFAPIILGSLGFIPAGKGGGIWIAGVFVWVGLMVLATPGFLKWGSQSAEKAYLAPLGLAITNTPGLKPDVMGFIGGGQKLIPNGPAIVEGERYGRLVHIETIDKHSLTILQAESPEFKAHSDAGKLRPGENAPEIVTKALKSLRKAKRWQGIEVRADSEGISIQRQSKGTNMWLYDLWLAEYLLDKIDAG